MFNFTPAMARTVDPMLTSLDSAQGQVLQSCSYREQHGCLEKITLRFETVSLIVMANDNDDSIEYDFEPNSHLPEKETPQLWQPFIGKELGWSWIAINQQGYCDGMMLSFDGINPSVLLNVVASSIRTFRLTPGANPQANVDTP